MDTMKGELEGILEGSVVAYFHVLTYQLPELAYKITNKLGLSGPIIETGTSRTRV
jgi:hypothetical protein